MSFPDIHRVVTGHDADGKAVAILDGPLATVVPLTAIPGTVFHEVWSTSATPVSINNDTDPTVGELVLPPPGMVLVFALWIFPPTRKTISPMAPAV